MSGVFSSLFSSSLSFGEYAAPNGLCMSSFEAGGLGFGVACGFMLDCDGGVEPDENFELRLEIHEPRRPIGFGALFGNGSAAGDVPLLEVESLGFISFSDRALVLFGSDLAGTGGRGGGGILRAWRAFARWWRFVGIGALRRRRFHIIYRLVARQRRDGSTARKVVVC